MDHVVDEAIIFERSPDAFRARKSDVAVSRVPVRGATVDVSSGASGIATRAAIGGGNVPQPGLVRDCRR